MPEPFPYDIPVYVGTDGVDNVDDLLAANPWPFNSTGVGVGDAADNTGFAVGVGPQYPIPFINGTNFGTQPDPDGWSPVYFIVYSQTFRVEVHGRFTDITEGEALFKLPDLIAPGKRIPLHGIDVDFSGGWRGHIDSDGTVYYMATF